MILNKKNNVTQDNCTVSKSKVKGKCKKNSFNFILKRPIFFAFLIFFGISQSECQKVPGSYYDFVEATKNLDVSHNKSKLIIYRPQNNGEMNEIRCFLRIQNQKGEDVTYTACTACYEWISNHRPQDSSKTLQDIFKSSKQNTPNLIKYKKKYFLSGSMAMHLSLKSGKYKITFFTPIENQNNFTYSTEGTKPFEWKSTIFEYDTENPAKVIFVTPTTNENGFYNGGWNISAKAPAFIKNRAVPKINAQ